MNNSNDKIGIHKGTSTLERARFGPGMLLQHDDLEKLNTYTRDLSRLMFQSFFGCGVVCGLIVSAKSDCGKLKVSFTSGLALACSGDPVYVPTDDSFLTDEKLDDQITTLWVVLCGTKKCCAPRVATCSSDDDEATSDCTREKDTYEIRVLRTRPECACGCPEQPQNQNAADPAGIPGRVDEGDCKCIKLFKGVPSCYDSHYNGDCGCNCGKCSSCDCQCIVLAKLNKPSAEDLPWKTDHSVRSFKRPVLMRDPQVEKERTPAETTPNQQQPQQQPPQQEKTEHGQKPLSPAQQLEEIHQEVLQLQAEERRLKRELKEQQPEVVVAPSGTSEPK
jgi:hypothetical protein